MESRTRPKRPAPFIPDLPQEPHKIQGRNGTNKENVQSDIADVRDVPEKKRPRLTRDPPPKPPRAGALLVQADRTEQPRVQERSYEEKRAAELSRLQERIEHEDRIRDGTVKLIGATSGWRHLLEASKSLFVCNAKIIALMTEVQRIKSQSGPALEASDGYKPCSAKLALSDIRIPLEWQEFESRRGKTDPMAVYSVFCLFKVGHEVVDTSGIVEVNRYTKDIVFDGIVRFEDSVGPDFRLEVEVYSAVPLPEDSHKTATPGKAISKLKKMMKEHSDSPSGSGSSSGSSSSSSSVPVYISNGSPTHRFPLAGHAALTLRDLLRPGGDYPLRKGAVGSSGTASTCGGEDGPVLPLWTQLGCNLILQPQCAGGARITGFVNVQQLVSGLPNWVRVWGIMRQNHLRCWMFPEDIGKKMPVQTITLTEPMTVENASRLDIRRPNALVLRDGEQETFIAFESKEDRSEWSEAMMQALVDLRCWKSNCDVVIPDKPGYKKPPPPPPPPGSSLPRHPPSAQAAADRPAVERTPVPTKEHPATTRADVRSTTAGSTPSRPPPLTKRPSKLTSAKKTPLALDLDPSESHKESLL